MKRVLFPSLVWLCSLVLAWGQLPVVEPVRGWKTAEGQPFQAAIAGFDGTTVIFRMPNGTRAQSPLMKLSAGDQAFLADWQKKQPIKVVMPDVVGVDTATSKRKW